ncbi:FliH/SctL family protein [Undibacterium squillarum]|uniref:Flagellar assembly protein FliH n=1 Tax=Undibacterium squillarum TaxID=1131567 RepID=A0ABQ2Y0P1_9BURK|nr:flagellar assembly protein FliH [Undibacterium squillarum]GGX49293.1 flagellar assembly protein FliH [Undibacterium squillarum]
MSNIIRDPSPGVFRKWEFTGFGQPAISTATQSEVLSSITSEPAQQFAEPEPEPAPPAVTEEELNAIREQARQAAYEDAYRSAYEQGLIEGRDAGYKELQETIAAEQQALQALAENMSQQFSAFTLQAEKDILALSLDIAEMILKTSLQLNPESILPVVRDAVAQIPVTQKNIEIQVNPDDATQVSEALLHGIQQLGWRVVADPNLSRGGCVIETPSNVIDASIETRWQQVQAAIHHSMNAAGAP